LIAKLSIAKHSSPAIANLYLGGGETSLVELNSSTFGEALGN